MQKQQMKEAAVQYIDAHKEEYIALGRTFYHHPELAFQEDFTAQHLFDSLHALHPTQLNRVAHTGVAATFQLGQTGPHVGVIAEIDATYIPNHLDANPSTGAAHTCGHHIQTTALVGVARALTGSGIAEHLQGSVSFFGCPAEEGGVSDALFEKLHDTEGLESRSGKQEMIRLGCFDGLTALLSTHALINDEKVTEPALLSAGCNGFNRWIFHLYGKNAHAAMDPSKGINAFNGAMLAMYALKCVRESLPLDDYSYISDSLDPVEHTSGIPDHVVLRVTTKSKTPEILEEIDRKVVCAVEGAAMSLGCKLEYEKIPGYQSFIADMPLSQIYMKNCEELTHRPVPIRPHGYYSNDLGNVSKLVPTSQIVVGGCSGALHSDRFRIDNEEMLYLLPSKMMICTIIDLLS